jgi:hypothetical protein
MAELLIRITDFPDNWAGQVTKNLVPDAIKPGEPLTPAQAAAKLGIPICNLCGKDLSPKDIESGKKSCYACRPLCRVCKKNKVGEKREGGYFDKCFSCSKSELA